ncbi:OmpA family protein [Taibaiella soli]|uniref:Flagellar motor protein MotB n=1 Tax=Taibaiella soli TaxID=1649169 RepID=A0A2W2BYV2_9BACT|nr:OmpA family protein [Taibaiella soli]PZF73063.1 flagellar motor protein MotB [Taibaiella soli]
MKRILIALACLMIGVAMLPSCVAKKKYLAAQSRINRLHADSLDLYRQVQELQGRVSKMEATNEFTNNKLNMSQEELAKQQKKLAQLQALIEQQQRNTEALRKKIADAMAGFSANQLAVTMKNGKVYVSMQESLLFPSGSAKVNDSGKAALATLATVLNQNPDINVNVEGHTDSVPIKKAYPDNWALSVARSTAIARILIDDYKVNPATITASGRSKYEPVETNETPEGRAHNRRTEIILEPKLDEIMKLIEGQQVPATETK